MTSYRAMTEKVNEELARTHDYAPSCGDLRSKAVLDHMDILIVAADMPLGYQPGTQTDRFRQLAAARHQFT
jgi:hypothetical protein